MDHDYYDYEKRHDKLRMQQWLLIEQLEEMHPYWRWGWCGFVPMVVMADNC